MTKTISFISDVLFSVVVWWITTLPDPKTSVPSFFSGTKLGQEFYTEFYKDRATIVLVVVLIVLALKLMLVYLDYRGKKKQISWLLSHIIKTEFKNEIHLNRFTLFQYKLHPLKAFLIRRKKLKILSSPDYKKFKKTHQLVVPSLLGRALYVMCRRGTPNEVGSLAYFMKHSDPENSDGIVSYVWNSEQNFVAENLALEHIETDELFKIFSDPTEEKRLIKRLKRVKLGSAIKMAMISRHSKHYWATMLYRRNEKKWGVLVFDSDTESSPLTDEVKEKLSSYTAIIRNIL